MLETGEGVKSSGIISLISATVRETRYNIYEFEWPIKK